MKRTIAILCGAAAFTGAALAADPMTVAKMYDSQLSMVEKEVVSLAEAMPADKYGFAPTAGAFQGVRTFAQQVKHLAAVVYMVAAAARAEKPPIDTGGESGPVSAQSKAQIVHFLQGSFAYAHSAAAKLTAGNQMDMVQSPFGDSKTARGEVLSVAVWHTFDHYGQMVVYARMNGVVPPASR